MLVLIVAGIRLDLFDCLFIAGGGFRKVITSSRGPSNWSGSGKWIFAGGVCKDIIPALVFRGIKQCYCGREIQVFEHQVTGPVCRCGNILARFGMLGLHISEAC